MFTQLGFYYESHSAEVRRQSSQLDIPAGGRREKSAETQKKKKKKPVAFMHLHQTSAARHEEV